MVDLRAIRREPDAARAALARRGDGSEELLTLIPNPPDPTAADEDTPLREVGDTRAGARDHLDLAGPLIDMEAAARVSGSRFAYLKGDMVLLELALQRWGLELLMGKGFEPVIP